MSPAAPSPTRQSPRASGCRSRRSSRRGRPPRRERLRPPPRILILSAAIGEGHDLPARMIRDGILEARPDAVVEIRDAIAEVGGIVQRLVGQEAPLQHRGLNWFFDLEYWLLFRFPPVRGFITWLGTRMGRSTVLRLVMETRPDVIVSTYPGTSEVLGRLRRTGYVHVPVASAITDLAALRLWASRGVDLHVITHQELAPEVQAIAPESRVVWARGMTSREFERPLAQDAGRGRLVLPATGGIVIVSGGGWGVGDMEGAIATASSIADVAAV